MGPCWRTAALAPVPPLLLLLLCCWTVTEAEAGSCWAAERRGRCTSLDENDISREDCCAKGSTYGWSAQEYVNQTGGRLLQHWISNGGGVSCIACKGKCSKGMCKAGEKCRVRRGEPKCVCSPNCRKLRAGRGRVCGTDNRTYRSHCKLLRRQCRKKIDLKVAYKGPCQRSVHLAASCAKVRCQRKNEQCVLDQNRVPHCAPCLRRCSNRVSKPICGVNGVTYKNRCQARRAACLNGSAIPIAYRGRCRRGMTCSRLRCKTGYRCLVTPKTRSPRCTHCDLRCKRRGRGKLIKVCGTNNRTYRSWCHMMKEACVTGLVIEVAHTGKCHSRRFSAADSNVTAPFSNLQFLLN